MLSAGTLELGSGWGSGWEGWKTGQLGQRGCWKEGKEAVGGTGTGKESPAAGAGPGAGAGSVASCRENTST